MRKVLIAASILALAACSQPAEQEPAAPAETATPEAAEPLAADGQPTAGLYKVTAADGTVFNEDVKADGTYVQTDADGTVIETGTWTQPSPDRYCTIVDAAYVTEDNPADEKCNTESIGDDGVWVSTNAEGETATVEREPAAE